MLSHSNLTIGLVPTCSDIRAVSILAMEEHIADVLMKPLARVKFEYFRENLGVLQIEVSSKRR